MKVKKGANSWKGLSQDDARNHRVQSLNSYNHTVDTAAVVENEGENSDFLYDQEDEDLLNSVTEVANSMLMGYTNVHEGGVSGNEKSVGLILRGFDMEWRNIM